MPVIVVCPSCGMRGKAPDRLVGKTVACSKCKALMTAQAADELILDGESNPDAISVRPRITADDPDGLARTPARRARHEEDDYDEPETRGRSRRPRFHCPFCDADTPPTVRTKVATGGWVTLILLLLLLGWTIVLAPVALLGLLIRDEYRLCSSCGTKIGG